MLGGKRVAYGRLIEDGTVTDGTGRFVADADCRPRC